MPFVQQHIQSEKLAFQGGGDDGIQFHPRGSERQGHRTVCESEHSLPLNGTVGPERPKDITAWTIGRICDLHVRSIPEDIFPTLVNGLAAKLLTETPRVSSQACFGIHNLAAAFQNDNAAATSGTNALSRECAPDVKEPHRSIAGTVDSSNHSSSSEDGDCGGNAARLGRTG